MRYGSIDGVAAPVSRLVLGSLALREEDVDLAFGMLDRFAAAGGTAIDTAHGYGRGSSERAVGRWLRERGARGRMVVITKGGHHAPDLTRRVNPEALAADMAESLDRLGLDRVDLYLLHRDDPAVPVGTIVDFLDEAARAGKIDAYGGSNWTTDRLEAANRHAAAHGRRPFAASSPNLALAVPREPLWPEVVSIAGDRAALDWYRRTGMPVLAWSSQARGFFTGRFRPEEVVDADVARVYYHPDNWARLERVRALAGQRGRSPAQVALAWVLHQPFPTFALIGPRSLDELDDCLAALEVELSPGEVAWLNLEADPA